MRGDVVGSIAVLALLGMTASIAAAPRAGSHQAARMPRVLPQRLGTHSVAPSLGPSSEVPGEQNFASLPALRFVSQNSGESATVRLYDASGHLDEAEATRLDSLLADARSAGAPAVVRLDRRTLQLAVRAALHFERRELLVVSAYRKPGRRREGPHASGRAIDFKLPGVLARTLAAYLRTLPRVGVGIYTHPKTAFVHLDDREHSFHWLDASPPGRHWRERSIGGTGLTRLDATYTRAQDWPEGTSPPEDASL